MSDILVSNGTDSSCIVIGGFIPLTITISGRFVVMVIKISYCSFFWFPSYVNKINQSINQSVSIGIVEIPSI